MYASINDYFVLLRNTRNAAVLVCGPLPDPLDRAAVKSFNAAIFDGVQVAGYCPGTFRGASPAGDLNISSRDVSSQSSRTIFSMRSFMDERALMRFDEALSMMKPDVLSGLTTSEFAQTISRIYALLDYTHPFFDGNSRTFRALTSLLSRHAGFNLNWDKTAVSMYLRDELYCARAVEVNRLALSDPDQQHYCWMIENMLGDLSDKRDLCTLLLQEKLVTPLRAEAFRSAVQRCFDRADNSPQAFKVSLCEELRSLEVEYSEFEGAFRLLGECIGRTIRDDHDLFGYQQAASVLLPAFYRLLEQGCREITAQQLTVALNVGT